MDTLRSTPEERPRIALVHPPGKSSLQPLLDGIASLGAHAESVAYRDGLAVEVRNKLLTFDAALVWVNPIEDGRDRSVLDALLREVASAGVFVSAHPDVIQKLGTKEVLYTTRALGWGCDTHLYRSVGDLERELPIRLASGEIRVLKQRRGNGGNGVWKIEAAGEGRVRARHAQRGAVEQVIPFSELLRLCEPYFAGGGCVIDQAWQPRLPEGMVRCYLVHDRVEGFGHQALVALHPTQASGPRLYHPPSKPEFQALKDKLEGVWVPQMQRLLGMETAQLPVLWDCDFLLGPRDASGGDTYVLCEINVSSVSPFPDSAVMPVARAALARAKEVTRLN